MREALTELLYARYPVLFAEHSLDAATSSMVWGFQHDDGWFAIIDALSSVLADHMPAATAVEVKQKMGALRFSLREGDAFTEGACAAAKQFSLTISEVSGRRGSLMARQRRWLKTLAPGELKDFVPLPAAAEPLNEHEVQGTTLSADPHGAIRVAAAVGADAFHHAMALRLDPETGACGPVDDQGLMPLRRPESR